MLLRRIWQSKPLFFFFRHQSMATSQIVILNDEELTKSIRQLVSFEQTLQLMKKDRDKIEIYGKTLLFEFLNELYYGPKLIKIEIIEGIFEIINGFQDLTMYEKMLKLNILLKFQVVCFSKFPENMNQEKQRLIKDIIELLKTQEVDLLDCFNLMILFQIDREPELFKLLLSKIDKNIYKIKHHFEITKSWNILFTRILQIPWKDLSQNKNIIKYITEDLSITSLKNVQALTELFDKIVLLRLHLVGLQKLPKFLDEAIKTLQSSFEDISVNSRLKLLSGFKYLPLNYSIKFYEKLKYTTIKAQGSNLVHYERYIPLNRLKDKALNEIFENFAKNWKTFEQTILYIFEERERKKFYMHPTIMRILEQIIKDYDKKGVNINQYSLAKISWITKILYENKRYQSATLGVNLLKQQVQKNKNFVYMKKFSLKNILNLIYIFQKHKLQNELEYSLFLYKKIKKFRQQVQSTIKNKSLNIFKAILEHINSDSQTIQKIIGELCEELLNNPTLCGDYNIKAPILFAFWNLEQKIFPLKTTYIPIILKELASSQEGLDMLVDYYFLEEKFSIRITNSVIQAIIDLKTKDNRKQFKTLMKLVVGVPLRSLISFRGTAHNNLITFLNKVKVKDLPVQIDKIKVWTKFISILSNFHPLTKVLQRMFLNCVNIFLDEIVTKKKEVKNFEFISFADQFYSLFHYQSMQGRLRSTYVMNFIQVYTYLMQKDDGIYLKGKYLQVIMKNNQTAVFNEKKQIQYFMQVEKVLVVSPEQQKLGDLALMLIELYILQLTDMEQKTINSYYKIVCSAIYSSYLTSHHFSKKLSSLSRNVVLTPSIKQKFEKFLSPLADLSLKVWETSNYYTLICFVQYFRFLDNHERVNQLLEKIASGFIHPLQISEIIHFLPRKHLKGSLIEKLKEKIKLNLPYFKSQCRQIIFFFQFLRYEDVKGEKQFFDALYQIVEEDIKKDYTKIVNSSTNSFYYLSKFNLFLACCIKSRRTKSTIFKKLLKFAADKEEQFQREEKENNRAKMFNRNIIAFYKASILKKQNVSVSMQVKKSEQVQETLKDAQIPFLSQVKINGTLVPYYSELQNTIFIPKNQRIYLSGIDGQTHLNGYSKFLCEVLKICTGKKVSFVDSKIISDR